MYVPKHFAIDEQAAVRELLALSPLVQLVSMTADGLVASAAPMLLVESADGLRLHGHLARANTHWSTHDDSVDSLAIISGPDTYVSPNSYATKARTHKVVPTWNYESVHARGPLHIHDDDEWVLDLVSRLTDEHERHQPAPWKVADAPAEYIAGMLKRIVGFEMEITSLDAKAKLSQDKADDDRQGVLATLHTGSDADRRVAERMTKQG